MPSACSYATRSRRRSRAAHRPIHPNAMSAHPSAIPCIGATIFSPALPRPSPPLPPRLLPRLRCLLACLLAAATPLGARPASGTVQRHGTACGHCRASALPAPSFRHVTSAFPLARSLCHVTALPCARRLPPFLTRCHGPARSRCLAAVPRCAVYLNPPGLPPPNKPASSFPSLLRFHTSSTHVSRVAWPCRPRCAPYLHVPRVPRALLRPAPSADVAGLQLAAVRTPKCCPGIDRWPWRTDFMALHGGLLPVGVAASERLSKRNTRDQVVADACPFRLANHTGVRTVCG